MFAKLLKHEFNRNKKLLGILTLALLGLGVAATIALRLVIRFGDQLQVGEDPAAMLAIFSTGSFLVLSIVALAVYSVAVFVILLVSFYRHKFTDEGYLTFTLPVKTEEIYWSSLCNIAIWELIAGLSVGFVVFIVLLFGTGRGSQIVNPEIFRVIFEDLGFVWEELMMDGAYVAQSVISYLVDAVFALVMPLACITIGAVLAKKHKILAAFGAYYAINMLVSILNSTVSVFPAMFMSAAYPNSGAMQVMSVVNIVLTAALCVGGYFLTVYLMKRRLNLP